MGPVAGDRAALPAPDQAAARARERGHTGAPRLVVEAQEREHDVRVLGRIEVGAAVGPRGPAGSGSASRRRSCRRHPADRAAPLTKRASWARRSCRRRLGRPVTVASAAYISAYQLTWLRRMVGQRKKRDDATRWMRSAIFAAVSSDSPSARRAFHACTSPSTISASKTRCWPASALPIELVQPGTCVCEPAAGWAAGRSMKTGGDTSARAIRRARWSFRAGPVWPSCAATLWVSSISELTSASTPPGPGRYWPLPSSHSGSSRSCIRSA